MDWWVMSAWSMSPAALVSWVVLVIGSIVLHELAHGWEAIRRGDRTPIESGHMTWNPLVHMGTLSLLVFALLGIAWGAMPVNPSRMRGRYAHAAVAFAGPMMNVSIGIVCLLLGCVWIAVAGGHWISGVSVGEPMFSNVAMFFKLGVGLSVALAAFNLLPVPPLDGGTILAEFYPPFARVWQTEAGQFMAIAAFALVFFVVGASVFNLGFWVADEAMRALLSVMI